MFSDVILHVSSFGHWGVQNIFYHPICTESWDNNGVEKTLAVIGDGI
jgi:hypothetical protein